MKKDIKPIFNWANTIGDANINNRILAKVIPFLVKEKITLTDSMLQIEESIEVPQNIYDLIKTNAQELLGAKYKEEE